MKNRKAGNVFRPFFNSLDEKKKLYICKSLYYIILGMGRGKKDSRVKRMRSPVCVPRDKSLYSPNLIWFLTGNRVRV
jgi:hypothetical protein